MSEINLVSALFIHIPAWSLVEQSPPLESNAEHLSNSFVDSYKKNKMKTILIGHS